MGIFEWLNNQLLKMEWLSDLISHLVENVFRLDTSERIGGSLHFFIYDVLKIFILLSVLIFIISYIQSYFPPERTKRILGRFKGIPANILSALLGTVTPFFFVLIHSAFYWVYKCWLAHWGYLFLFNLIASCRFGVCPSAGERF